MEKKEEKKTLYHLGYISQSLNPMTPDDLRALLEQSRNNNQKRNVSGILLYKNSTFIQLLEGEKKTLEETLEYISQDLRHHSIHILFFDPIDQRSFSNWSMGFHHLGNNDTERIPSMNYFLQGNDSLDEYLTNNKNHKEKFKSILFSFKDKPNLDLLG